MQHKIIILIKIKHLLSEYERLTEIVLTNCATVRMYESIYIHLGPYVFFMFKNILEILFKCILSRVVCYIETNIVK